MAVVVRALHHLDHLPVVRLREDLHPAVHAAQVHRVVRLRVVHAQDHHVQVQVHIATVHLPVVAPQVVVIHPIAALTQVVARGVDRQIDAMVLVIHQEVTHRARRPAQVRIDQQVVHTLIATRVHHHAQVQIAHPVHTEIVQNVVTIVDQVRIDQQVVRMAIEIHDQVRARLPIVANAVTGHVIPDQVQIAQRVVPTEIVIQDQVHDHLLIAANVVTVHAIHDQVQIVEIVVQVPIVQRDVRPVTVIPVHHRDQVRIVQQVVHMVTAIHVRAHVQLQIVHVVARRVDRQIDAMIVIMERETHEHQQTNPAEVIHTLAIVHAQAMTATHVRLHVTANAVVVQIVPAAVFPMIEKNVHAVALVKSA